MRTGHSHYHSWRGSFLAKSYVPSRTDLRVLELAKRDCLRLDSIASHQLIELSQKLRGLDPHMISDPRWLARCLAMASRAISFVLGVTPFDVQLLAGIAMTRGAIVQMQTGEGKTLTSVFPAVTHALLSRKVHVATVNAYLAQRDYDLLKPVFELMGFSTGISTHGQSSREKQQAYACDITFATGYQLGFDFLADQLALAAQPRTRLGQRLLAGLTDPAMGLAAADPIVTQSPHAVAIIDEVDSVLLDEAITPLILSKPMEQAIHKPASTQVYLQARQVASQLRLVHDFTADTHRRTVTLTPNGQARASEAFTQLQRACAIEMNRPWSQSIEAALRAELFMRRDIDYVVRQGKIELVDQSTGRIFHDRHWRDGLHQAVEAKEGLDITHERTTHARICRQRYYQRYQVLCGMTGTATGHEQEWREVYGCPVVVIPTRKPSQRVELPTVYTSTIAAKVAELVVSIRQFHSMGRPVLIGTRTIEQSHRVSLALVEAGLNHRLLNGVQEEDEAALIRLAGNFGAITVATHMAGRGTDIIVEPSALEIGGLHVIGFERNSSPRVDRQLLGRAGRQGQPGSGQFFVSAEDELLVRYGAQTQQRLARLTQPLRCRATDRDVRRMQQAAEAGLASARQQAMNQELWLNQMRSQVAG